MSIGDGYLDEAVAELRRAHQQGRISTNVVRAVLDLMRPIAGITLTAEEAQLAAHALKHTGAPETRYSADDRLHWHSDALALAARLESA